MKSINLRLSTYLLAAPTLLFYGLALTGCISNSPGIPSIFLVKLQGSNATQSALPLGFEIRVGYFGLCVGNPSNLACYSTPGTSADQLLNRIYGGGGNTTTTVASSSAAIRSLFSLAFTLQRNIFLWLLAAAGSAFFLGLVFLTLLKRHLKKTETNANAESRRSLFRRLSVGLLWGSTALALATAISITQTVSALQFSTTSLQATTIITSGLVLQVLQWLDFVFSFFFTLGVTLIVWVVYYAGCRSEDNNAMLELFRRYLTNSPQVLSFEALYRNIRFGWRQQDDIANPFGDHRECLVSAVWVIDLDNDILQLHKKDQNRRIPLHNLRQGPLSIADLEPYNPPPLAQYSLWQYLGQPTWNPKCKASKRHVTYVSKLLEDFSYQWRHVLRSRYNNPTFRRLARAIIRIVTLDFQVDEITYVRPNGLGSTVALKDLPTWDFFPNHIIHLGGISIVLCQHLTRKMRGSGKSASGN